LTGALGTHFGQPITYQVEAEVKPTDTIHVYFALDAATTGVHTIQAYIKFSSHSPAFHMHSQKSAVIAASATANTEAGSATLSTRKDMSSEVIGFWNYVTGAGGLTAAQTVGGYITVNCTADRWQAQEIPTNILPSGLGTEVDIFTAPMWIVPKNLFASGVHNIEWEDPFPVSNQKVDFVITNRMDGTNTGAPGGRYGLIWKR